MRGIKNKYWPRIWRAVSMLVVGAWLLTAYQGVASAADIATDAPVQITGAAAISMMQGVPQHDHALPTITMWQENADKPCSFSLYDGQQINFKENSSCPNDEHYYFSIHGAHEGMWLEIQNNPDCGNNESYAFYKVSFQDQQIGDIGKTVVQLSQQKDVGTRLIDGDGKPYLLANGWRGSSPLQGAVSCVKVGQLLPDGPFRYRAKLYPDFCLASKVESDAMLGGEECDGGVWSARTGFYSTLSSGTPTIYAAWIARTSDYIPALYKRPNLNYSEIFKPGGFAGSELVYGEDGRFRVGSECLHQRNERLWQFYPCAGTDDEVFIRERYVGRTQK